MSRQDISGLTIRAAAPADLDAISGLAYELWPDAPIEEHRDHAAQILAGEGASILPLTLIVAQIDGRVIGFIEVGLRSHADGCYTQPVGFIEGWCVAPQFQRRAVGRALMAAAEQWSVAHGVEELASDTWLDSAVSQHAHESLGFEVVDRVVHYRKSLLD